MLLRRLLSILLIGFLVFATTGGALAQEGGPVDPQVAGPQVGETVSADAGSGFTYQGELKNGGSPVNATCDFQFGLYDALTLGAQQGVTQTVTTGVAAGRFTVTLNAAAQFGARAFDGSARWLATSVRCPAGSGGYTSLTPRQPLTAAPLAFALPGLRTELVPNYWPNIIGGDSQNSVTAGEYAAFIGSGSGNDVTASFGIVVGGQDNTAGDSYATVGGGAYNTASGYLAAIGGGRSNTASGWASFVGGGGYNGNVFAGNTAAGIVSTVGGGMGNTASGQGAFIGGGGWNGTSLSGNTASGNASTIGGGLGNTASGLYSTVAGGDGNAASNDVATIGGGQDNTASGDSATVGGGFTNSASGDSATVSGGWYNIASSQYATVGGGYGNLASGVAAFVGGGGFDGVNYNGNTAAGLASTISGGFKNVVTTTATFGTIGGGGYNLVSNQHATVIGGAYNNATGFAATVAGGYGNTASGQYSFAAGADARAVHNGSFVWANQLAIPISSTATGQFLVRATGGISLTTNAAGTTGCNLSAGGGTWNCISDRNAKANFAPVDSVAVLDALMAIPIQTWNFNTQDAAIQHMGPMAQDFYAAYGLGEGELTISTVDADGVALAAIQGLHTVVQEKDAAIAALEARVAALESGGVAANAPVPAPATNTLQLVVVLVLGLVAGGGLTLGAFALGRRQR